jgi:hypothetical protein
LTRAWDVKSGAPGDQKLKMIVQHCMSFAQRQQKQSCLVDKLMTPAAAFFLADFSFGNASWDQYESGMWKWYSEHYNMSVPLTFSDIGQITLRNGSVVHVQPSHVDKFG